MVTAVFVRLEQSDSLAPLGHEACWFGHHLMRPLLARLAHGQLGQHHRASGPGLCDNRFSDWVNLLIKTGASNIFFRYSASMRSSLILSSSPGGGSALRCSIASFIRHLAYPGLMVKITPQKNCFSGSFPFGNWVGK